METEVEKRQKLALDFIKRMFGTTEGEDSVNLFVGKTRVREEFSLILATLVSDPGFCGPHFNRLNGENEIIQVADVDKARSASRWCKAT